MKCRGIDAMRHGRVLPHPAALQGLGGPHELQHNVSEESGERESKSCSHLSVCLSVSVSVSVSVSLGFCVSLSRMRPGLLPLAHSPSRPQPHLFFENFNQITGHGGQGGRSRRCGRTL